MSYYQSGKVLENSGNPVIKRPSPMTQLIGALMVGTIPMLTLAVLFVGFEIIPLGLAFAGYLVGGFF